MQRLLVLVLAAGLSACSGGGGTPGGTTAFQVSQVTPFDQSEDVPLMQEVNVIFSRPVDPLTLTPDSLQVVAESGDAILGTRLVAPLNPGVVRFLPRNGYFPFAVHTIRVTTDVHDTAGDPLDRDYAFRFQTEAAGPVLPDQTHVEDRGATLQVGRWFHGMTLLGNNRFLIAGGYISSGTVTNSAEILVVDTRSTFTVAGGLLQGRGAHVQVTLQDGRVLIAGGEISDDPFVPTVLCEIFDPSDNSLTQAASLRVARSFAHGALLQDGRVLVTGGQSVDAGGFHFRSDAEIYDPVADDWTLVASPMGDARSGHFSATLPLGEVLVLGGVPGIAAAELWSPSTGEFAPVGPPISVHFLGAGTLLPDGRPFVAGGFGSQGVTIFDPAFGFLQAINQMTAERAFATATAFDDGRVLLVGGSDLSRVPALISDTVEIFFPIGQTGKVFSVPNLLLPEPTSHHAAARGPEGAVWITGGLPIDLAFPARDQLVIIHPEPVP